MKAEGLIVIESDDQTIYEKSSIGTQGVRISEGLMSRCDRWEVSFNLLNKDAGCYMYGTTP